MSVTVTHSRRTVLFTAAAVMLAPAACAAEGHAITVYKTPWCGCCGGWVKHLQAAGFRTKVVEVQDLTEIRNKHGIPFALSSCHTGVSDGYAFEGHVPAADVLRFLAEKPMALGLTVPGMPLGSPGMEVPHATAETFETLLLLEDGATKVFARHAPTQRLKASPTR